MYVVLASIATGAGSATSCQPDADSFVNVASARSVPVLAQRWPRWASLFPAPETKQPIAQQQQQIQPKNDDKKE